MPVKPLLSRRSVSPFGLKEPEPSVFQELTDLFDVTFPKPADASKPAFKSWVDAWALPELLQRIFEAPSGDSPKLSLACQFLTQYKNEWYEKGVANTLYAALEKIFDAKTELFLIDHYDKAACEKNEWPDEFRNVVLFAKERDTLVGQYFALISPGQFSEFVNKWSETGNSDRILHFLDFCIGSKNPTFEHYLLFTHPALARILRNKSLLKDRLQKSEVVLKKLPAESWLTEVKKALEL